MCVVQGRRSISLGIFIPLYKQIGIEEFIMTIFLIKLQRTAFEVQVRDFLMSKLCRLKTRAMLRYSVSESKTQLCRNGFKGVRGFQSNPCLTKNAFSWEILIISDVVFTQNILPHNFIPRTCNKIHVCVTTCKCV